MSDIDDGIYPAMPEAEYHAIRRASPSRLCDLERSPAYAQWRATNPSDDSTPDRLRGQALHCLLFEPDAFASRYALKDYDARTKDGKARKEQVERLGLKVLDVDTWDAAHRSADAVRLHPLAKRILDAAPNREVSVLSTLSGVKCKGRIDAYGDGILLDLKSTKDALEATFPRFVAQGRVDRQLAIYSALLQAHGMFREGFPETYAVTVMPDQPHEVRVYEFDDATLCDAWESADNLIRQYKACEESGAWVAGGDQPIAFQRAPWDRLGKPVAIEDMIL